MKSNEKAKGTWKYPSPNYYQSIVAELWHKNEVTRSNFYCKRRVALKAGYIQYKVLLSELINA